MTTHLSFVSATTGADDLPPPSDELTRTTPADRDPADPASVVDHIVAASAKALIQHTGGGRA